MDEIGRFAIQLSLALGDMIALSQLTRPHGKDHSLV
jgi:hypothetical protein